MGLLILAGCQDDKLDGGYPAAVGSEISFAVNHATFDFNEKTKTVYGDVYGEGNNKKYPIYWENGDQIGIFCPEGSSPDNTSQFDYKVLVDNETSSKGTLAKINPGENGLQWGDGDTHNFYAIYPASASEGGISDTTVMCNIPLRQDPKEIIFDEATNTYIAYPNMEYAYMYAHTQVSRKTQGDQPIELVFKPLVTVLEITINGPKSDPATGPYQVSQIAIRSTQNITGEFLLTVSPDVNSEDDGKCTNIEDGTVSNLLTIPTYYQGKPVELKAGQKLVVKAFMLPYASPEKETTTVTVNMVGQGSNTKILATADIEAQKINITSLPALEGTNFYYWLTSMDENTYFSQLSIPGTHNSYSIGSNVVGTNDKLMVAYQTKTIEEQFRAGARAFSLMVGFERGMEKTVVDYQNGGHYQKSHTNWNNDYPLYVYDGQSSSGITLEEALGTYVDLLSTAINNYNGPEGRECQEFIVLHIDYKQITGSGDNNQDKYREVKRWIREVDRILNNYQPANGISFETNISANTRIADLKGKIVLLVNYQSPALPENEGAVSHGWYGIFNTHYYDDDEEYPGFTFNPNDGTSRNYIFMRKVYDESGEITGSGSGSFWARNDRDYTYPYYMIPEGAGADVKIWKQTLQRLNNPFLGDGGNLALYAGRINTKIQIAKSFIDEAIRNNLQEGTAGLDNWYINNLGGFCVVDIPDSYNAGNGESGNTVLAAHYVNEEIYKYLIDPEKNSGPLGIVMMNFIGNRTMQDASGTVDVYGEWLPQIIMENNFRFPLKRSE